jgi:hypothetical protein
MTSDLRHTGAISIRFSTVTDQVLSVIAAALIALQRADHRRAAVRVAALSESDRMAADLRDGAVRRLLAIGTALTSLGARDPGDVEVELAVTAERVCLRLLVRGTAAWLRLARLPGRSPSDATRCRVLPAGGRTVVEWALTLGPDRNIRRADGVGRAVTHAQEGTR